MDTSALVKLYVQEAYSDIVKNVMSKADNVVCHVIGYIEARATFARHWQDVNFGEEAYQQLKQQFEIDWSNYSHIHLTASLLKRAADLAEAFRLRAYDSIHLAAADMLAKSMKQQVIFACFDKKLNQAAKILGLELL